MCMYTYVYVYMNILVYVPPQHQLNEHTQANFICLYVNTQNTYKFNIYIPSIYIHTQSNSSGADKNMYFHVYIFKHICMHTYLCVYICTYIYIYTYVHMCIYVYIYTYIYTDICMYIYIYNDIYLYIYVFMYIYVQSQHVQCVCSVT